MIHVNQVLSLKQSRWWWVKLCTHLRSTGSGTFCRPSNECCHRHRAPLITNLSPAKVYGLALLPASPGRGSLSLISASVVLEMPKAAHRQQRSPTCHHPSQESDSLLVSTGYSSPGGLSSSGQAGSLIPWFRAWVWSFRSWATWKVRVSP